MAVALKLTPSLSSSSPTLTVRAYNSDAVNINELDKATPKRVAVVEIASRMKSCGPLAELHNL